MSVPLDFGLYMSALHMQPPLALGKLGKSHCEHSAGFDPATPIYVTNFTRHSKQLQTPC